MLRQIDSNTDGLVDFHEFVAATLQVHQLEEHDTAKWNLRCQAAFQKFDVDNDGFITPEELRMVHLFHFQHHASCNPKSLGKSSTLHKQMLHIEF